MKKTFLFLAALLTATVMNLQAANVYFKVTSTTSWWANDGAKIGALFKVGTDPLDEGAYTQFFTLVPGTTDTYVGTVPVPEGEDPFVAVQFLRYNSAASNPEDMNYWNATVLMTWDGVNNDMFTATAFGDTWDSTTGTWSKYTPATPDMHDFLYFVGLNGNDTVRLNKVAGDATYLADLTATFEYSKDRIKWLDYTWGADSKTGADIALTNAGDTVFFRAKGTNGLNATMNYGGSTYFCFAFGADDQIAAGGNVMSLYDATCEQDTMTEYGFYYLFNKATQLVSAPKLPATKLAIYCYDYMFRGCTALTQAPELKATTLAKFCYGYMFQNCTALTQAPELKATTLAPSCYQSMLNGCTSLTQAPELKADTLAEQCYSNMFKDCTALTQAPELKATTLAKSCYQGMFNGCTALEVNTFSSSCDGAELVVPDTTAAPKDWNRDMFKGCKGDTALTAKYGIQLNSHYCIREYVELAPYTRNVTSGNYGTICLEREAVSLKGAAFYEVLGKIADSQVVLAEVDTLEAGKPYVFKADSSAIECAYNTAKEAVTDTVPGNGIIGSFAGCDVPTGMYIISLTDSKLHKTGTDCKIDANRAYFNLSTMTNAPQAPARKLHYIGIYQDAATGLQDVENAMPIQKMMINGQLMILRDGKMYNAQGQAIGDRK